MYPSVYWREDMAYHCDTCSKHPDAFRLGYDSVMTDSKPMTVNEIQKTTPEQDLSGWWTAYYHGRGLAQAVLTT